MKRIFYNNHQYILARIWPERGAELVSCSDGTVTYIEPSKLNLKETFERFKPTYPGNIEFRNRVPSFVQELQQRRIEFLQEAARNKQRKSGPRKGKTLSNSGSIEGDRKPARAISSRVSKQGKLEQQLELMLQKKLEQKVPAELLKELRDARN